MAAKTIIDRDIEFYSGCVETISQTRRSCPPADEAFYMRRLRLACDVVTALKAYKLNCELDPPSYPQGGDLRQN